MSENIAPRTPERKEKTDEPRDSFSPQTQPASPALLPRGVYGRDPGWDLVDACRSWSGLLKQFVDVVNLANDATSESAYRSPEKTMTIIRAIDNFGTAIPGAVFDTAIIASVDATISDTDNSLLRDELLSMRSSVFAAQKSVLDAMVCVNALVATR